MRAACAAERGTAGGRFIVCICSLCRSGRCLHAPELPLRGAALRHARPAAGTSQRLPLGVLVASIELGMGRRGSVLAPAPRPAELPGCGCSSAQWTPAPAQWATLHTMGGWPGILTAAAVAPAPHLLQATHCRRARS